jgi:aromatic amino acid aminotransferase I
LVGLSAQYTKRRDFFVDLLFQKFDIKIEELSDKSNGSAVYRASLFKSKLKGPIFSFVPPVAGMFVWASANSVFQSPCAKVIAVEIFF